MPNFKDVFISYGRADSKAFAIKLKERLIQDDLSVWLDLSDIPLGIDFQKNIDDSLQKAHNFLFIISPYAINSPYCSLELERALLFKKRIIPLMHVEETSYATWQQRHPEGTDSDWQKYKAEGRNSSRPNMHPEIRKLNWAFFREDIDDFELAAQDLVKLLKTETDYIHTHTQILNQALTWADNQRQTRYLLTGKSWQRAKDWLISENNLVSCEPSDLHCDFISQSIKNAHNLMCNVFLSYAEEDIENAQKIRRSLVRQAITVWTSRTDILTGEDFVAAIHRGIEQADNLIYLISPGAIASKYCQDELRHALYLNKRIIPVLSQPTDIEQIPKEIHTLQWIDLTNNVTEDDYLDDESQILQVIKLDAPYHEDHKNLLGKALKWQRQEDNPSILLKGQSLNHYTTWLKLAQKRELYRPIELQEEFVVASSQQSPDVTVDVFIVSSPEDLDFARKLNETLQVQGQSTWFEQESLVLDADYDEEIKAGITASENVAFILSPDALECKKCKPMLDYAFKLNKRILVILYDNHQQVKMPPFLKDYPLYDFKLQDGDFLSNFGRLYRAFESQPEHIREHTRLLVKAKEWEGEGYDDSLLLRGRYLTTAADWLSQADQSTPLPTKLQRQYIEASQALPLRRVRPLSVVLFGAATTLVVALANMLSLFQSPERLVYGHLLRQRWTDAKPDKRFVIVKIDSSSGAYLRDKSIAYLRDKSVEDAYKPGIGSIPEQSLLDALQILDSYQPKLIGLDIYRDFPADPELPELVNKLEIMDNLVGICKATSGEGKRQEAAGKEIDPDLRGFHAVNEVPRQDYPHRIGFNDVLGDNGIGTTVRRHYLVKEADPEFCDVRSAFSLVLARRYLEGEGIEITGPEVNEETLAIEHHSLKVGQITVPQLLEGGHAGGLYFNPEHLLGYQTLLNFRTVDGNPEDFAESVLFKDVLEGKVTAEQIRNRIVLIGYTDISDNNTDLWNTPYGDVHGVVLHGQMTSQLISAALKERPLIWWLPMGGSVLWLFGWSVLGGFIVWGFYRPLPFVLATGGGGLLIYATSWGVMSAFAGFLPVVPAITTLLITGGIIIFCNYRLRKV